MLIVKKCCRELGKIAVENQCSKKIICDAIEVYSKTRNVENAKKKREKATYKKDRPIKYIFWRDNVPEHTSQLVSGK